MRAGEKGIDIREVAASGPNGLVIEKDVLAFTPAAAPAEPKATPLAKKVAELEKVALADVSGTGSHGKITKDDVAAKVAARAAAAGAKAAAAQAASAPAAAPAGIPGRGDRVVKMSRMRKIIAKNMVDSLQTAAQLQHLVTVDMTNAGKLREVYKKKNVKISYNDIVLMAASRALMEFPALNAAIDGDNIVYHDYVNLGMAVAVDDGLIVPNIKDADLMRLEEISAASKDLAARTRSNKLLLTEMKGGTFTVSNLGMYGLDSFTGIINPPESGILALGAIKKTPVVVNDEIVIRPMMSITLSYDHRIADGAPAAEFLVRIKEFIEEPTLML